MKKRLCDELKKWRYNQRKSQQELAERIGVSQSTLHKWESCKSEIPVKYYPNICKMVNLNLSDMIPDGLIFFIEETADSHKELQFDASDILRLIEENNVFLRKRVNDLERENQFLKKRLSC